MLKASFLSKVYIGRSEKNLSVIRCPLEWSLKAWRNPFNSACSRSVMFSRYNREQCRVKFRRDSAPTLHATQEFTMTAKKQKELSSGTLKKLLAALRSLPVDSAGCVTLPLSGTTIISDDVIDQYDRSLEPHLGFCQRMQVLDQDTGKLMAPRSTTGVIYFFPRSAPGWYINHGNGAKACQVKTKIFSKRVRHIRAPNFSI